MCTWVSDENCLHRASLRWVLRVRALFSPRPQRFCPNVPRKNKSSHVRFDWFKKMCSYVPIPIFGQKWSNKVPQSLFLIRKNVLEHYFGHRNIISGHLEHFTLRKPILVFPNAQGGTGIFGASFGVKICFRRGKRLQMTRNDVSMPKIMLRHTFPN